MIYNNNCIKNKGGNPNLDYPINQEAYPCMPPVPKLWKPLVQFPK